MNLSASHIRAIVGWAAATPAVERVVLFGSYAKGTANAESDVDLAIKIFEDCGPLVTFVMEGDHWQTILRVATGLLVNLEILHELEAPKAWGFVQEAGIVLYPSRRN